MKVNIGPYVNWWGPYQIAEKLIFWKSKYTEDGDFDDQIHNFGKWLAEDKNGEPTWFMKVCEWIHSKQKRKIKVKIDKYDLWNVDSTLSHVIHPLLVEFVKNIHSTAMVDKEDVPEELHSTYGQYSESDGGMSSMFSNEAWLYVLNEMIYAFDPQWDDKYGFGSEDYDREQYQKSAERQQKGYELFGKYFSRIWS